MWVPGHKQTATPFNKCLQEAVLSVAPASHSNGLVHRIKVLLVGLPTESLTVVHVMVCRGNAKNCGDTWSKIFKKEPRGDFRPTYRVTNEEEMLSFLRDTQVFAFPAACICVVPL